MLDTKYILEYRYNEADADDWRSEEELNNATQAHCAFTDHVKEYPHITVRVRKVRYVAEESVVADFNPMSVEEYND